MVCLCVFCVIRSCGVWVDLFVLFVCFLFMVRVLCRLECVWCVCILCVRGVSCVRAWCVCGIVFGIFLCFCV